MCYSELRELIHAEKGEPSCGEKKKKGGKEKEEGGGGFDGFPYIIRSQRPPIAIHF